MQLVGLTLALIGLAVGESLKKLDTSLTILTKNDLRGMDNAYLLSFTVLIFFLGASSPDAGTAVIVTDARPFHDVSNVCSKLGEQLWRSGKGNSKDKERETSALPFAEYLKYDGTGDASSKFWVRGSGPAAVDIAGRLQTVNLAGHSRFAGLCTNTAPFSNQSAQDTSSTWQISLDVNNQTITG